MEIKKFEFEYYEYLRNSDEIIAQVFGYYNGDMSKSSVEVPMPHVVMFIQEPKAVIHCFINSNIFISIINKLRRIVFSGN